MIRKANDEALDNMEPTKSGEIWVNQFNEASATKFREQMIQVVMRDASMPIIIYIDSYGGYVYSLAKMMETMDQVPNPIITVCMGKAMSCGAILLSHGHYRYCTPNSSVLIHEVSAGTEGDVHDMLNDATTTKKLNERFMGILAENCNIKGGYKGLRKIIKDRDGRDINLDSKEALKFGIVDEVGSPGIAPQVIYHTQTIQKIPRAQLVKRAKEVLGIRKK